MTYKYPFQKIVVAAGLGKMRNLGGFEDKLLPAVEKELALITGQKPSRRQTKKAIAGFKTRVGDVVGLQVTLRGARMMDFLKKVVNIVLPRVKDFRGLSPKNIDHDGNLNIGFKEQFTFPEISAERSPTSFGLQITIVPRRRDRKASLALYQEWGMPLKKE